MRAPIKSLLLIAFLIDVSQLYCMNKDNIKLELQENASKILADKEMKIILKNQLRPEIIDQEKRIEEEIDMHLLKILLPGSIISYVAWTIIEIWVDKLFKDWMPDKK